MNAKTPAPGSAYPKSLIYIPLVILFVLVLTGGLHKIFGAESAAKEEMYSKKNLRDVLELAEGHVLDLTYTRYTIQELSVQKAGIGIRVYQTRLRGRKTDSIIVAEVESESAKKVLQSGDEVLRLNGTLLKSIAQLAELATSNDLNLVGTTITLVIDRDDKTKTVIVPRILLWESWSGTPKYERLKKEFKAYEKHALASAKKARGIVEAMDDKETIPLNDPRIKALNASLNAMFESRDIVHSLIDSVWKQK